MEPEKRRSFPRVAAALATIAPTHQGEEEDSKDSKPNQLPYLSTNTSFHFKHNIDISDEDHVLWLQQIRLWDFANLPWVLWCSNPNAQLLQLSYLKRTKMVTINEQKVS